MQLREAAESGENFRLVCSYEGQLLHHTESFDPLCFKKISAALSSCILLTHLEEIVHLNMNLFDKHCVLLTKATTQNVKLISKTT